MFYCSVYPPIRAFLDTSTSKMYSANKNSIFTSNQFVLLTLFRNLSEFRVMFNDVLLESTKDVPEIASSNYILPNTSKRYILIKQI